MGWPSKFSSERFDGLSSKETAHASPRAPGQKLKLHVRHLLGQSRDMCLPTAPQPKQRVDAVRTGGGLVQTLATSLVETLATALTGLARARSTAM